MSTVDVLRNQTLLGEASNAVVAAEDPQAGHVYSERDGSLLLGGISESLAEMALVDSEAIENKLPAIIGPAATVDGEQLPDYEVARRDEEERGLELAHSLESDEARMTHGESTSQSIDTSQDDEFLEALRTLLPTTGSK